MSRMCITRLTFSCGGETVRARKVSVNEGLSKGEKRRRQDGKTRGDNKNESWLGNDTVPIFFFFFLIVRSLQFCHESIINSIINKHRHLKNIRITIVSVLTQILLHIRVSKTCNCGYVLNNTFGLNNGNINFPNDKTFAFRKASIGVSRLHET